MAKIFFDANIFIDFIEARTDISKESFNEHSLYLSPLSIHILSYLYKYQMPAAKLANIELVFTIIPFDQLITINAVEGPTTDFEDNVQLHSAAEANCDIFLTNDKDLLYMKFFGKMKIIKEIE